MATLNVKSFPDALYKRLQENALREHRSVSQEVVHLLETALAESKIPSVLEFEGLGAEVWEGIDAAEYVDSERRSWD